MSDLVSPDEIERIVGRHRSTTRHFARAVSAEQTVYILHSRVCKALNDDLRDCEYSLALDRGIDEYEWSEHEDRAVQVAVKGGLLVPAVMTS